MNTSADVISTITPIGYVIALALVALVAAIAGYKSTRALAAWGKDENGKDVPWALLRSFPTTNGRIVVELALAVVFILVCMMGDMISHPVSEGTQNTLGLFIAAMLGIGAGQFVGKRTTDSNYVEAKGKAKAAGATTVVANEANVTGSPVNVEEGR